MESEKWNKVLVEWVNCLKLSKAVKNLKELRNGVFYSKLQSVLTQNSDLEPDLTVWIFSMIKSNYPNYLIASKPQQNLSDIPIEDLKGITSLLLHFTCIYDRRDALTSPLCHNLAPTTQMIIKNFLEKIDKNVTQKVLDDVVKTALDCANNPEKAKKYSFHNCQSSHTNSPLMDILSTPQGKVGKFQEKDRIIARLESELEYERDEKVDLQKELKKQTEKNQKIQKQLEERFTEISRLRGELMDLENRTLPHCDDIAARDIQKRLQTEIEGLEEYIKKLEAEQEEIRAEKDAAKEKYQALEVQCSAWQEKCFDAERSVDEISKANREKEERIKALEVHCSELSALLDEFRNAPGDDSSMFLNVKGVDLLRANGSCEDLACSVVEVQLRDAQKQNEQLKGDMDEIQRTADELKRQIETIREQLHKSQQDFEAVRSLKDELLVKLETVEQEHSATKQKLNDAESDLETSTQMTLETQEQLKISQREFEEVTYLLGTVKTELYQSQQEKDVILGQLHQANQVSRDLSLKIEKLESLLETANRSTAFLQNEKEEILIKLETLGLQYTISEEKLDEASKELASTKTLLGEKCKEFDELNDAQDNLKSLLTMSENRVGELQKENGLVKSELLALQKDTKSLIDDLTLQLRKSDEDNRNIHAERCKIIDQLDVAKMELLRLRGQVDELETKLQSEYEAGKEQQMLNEHLSELNEKYENSIKNLEAQLENVRNVKEDLGISLEAAHDKLERFEKTINVQVAELAESSRQMSLLQDENTEILANVKILEEQNETYKYALQIINHHLDEAKESAAIQERALTTCQTVKDELETELKTIKGSLETVLGEKSTLEERFEAEHKMYESDLKELKLKMNEAKEQKEILSFRYKDLALEFNAVARNYEESRQSLQKLEGELESAKALIDEKNQQLEEMERKNKKLDEKKVKLQMKLEQRKAKQLETENYLQTMTEDYENLREALDKKRAQFDALQENLSTEIASLSVDRKELQLKIDILNDNYHLLQDEKSRCENDLQRVKTDNESLTEELYALRAELSDQVQANRVLNDDKFILINSMSELREKINVLEQNWQVNVMQMEKEARLLYRDKRKLQADQTVSEQEITKLTKLNEELENEQKSLLNAIDDLTSAQISMEAKSNEAENRLACLQKDYDNFRRESEASLKCIEELEANKNQLKHQVCSMENQMNDSERLVEDYRARIMELDDVAAKLRLENEALLAEKRELLQNETTDHEHVATVMQQLKQSEDLCRKLTEHSQELTLQLQTVDNKYQEQIECLRNEQSSMANQLETLQNTNDNCQSELNACLLENQRVNTLLANSKESMAKLECENESLTGKVLKNNDTIKKLLCENAAVRKEVNQMCEQLRTVGEELTSFRSKFEAVCQEKNDLVKKLKENENQIEALQAEKRLLTAKIEELEDGKIHLEADHDLTLSKIQEQLDQMTAEKCALEKKLEIYEIMGQETQEKMKRSDETIQDYEITISGLKNVIENNLQTLNELRDENQTIKDQNEVLQALKQLLIENQMVSEGEEQESSEVCAKIRQILEENIKLTTQLDDLKVESDQVRNVSSQLKAFLETLQMLVSKRVDYPIDLNTIEDSIAKIQGNVQNALSIKEKLSEQLSQVEGEKSDILNELNQLKLECEQQAKDNVELTNVKAGLAQALQEEQEKVANLTKQIDNVVANTNKTIADKENNVLAQNTKLNIATSKEEDFKKVNAMLKKKLLLSEHSKSNLEKTIKELRQAKTTTSDEKSEQLKHDLDTLKEAYGNVLSANSKLEFENLSLKKMVDAQTIEGCDVTELKQAYEKLLEENNKFMTEVDTIKYKRMRDKEEFLRLLRKQREEGQEKHAREVQQVRSEYECKLEKIKDKMLRMYREEVNKEVQKVKESQQNKNTAMKTVAKLENQLYEAQERIHLLEMQKEMRAVSDQVVDTRNPPYQSVSTRTSLSQNYPRQSAATFPRSMITEEITLRRTSFGGPPGAGSIPSNLGHGMQMEDEDDLFNDKFLTDLKEGRCTLPKTARDSNTRYSELAWRNSLVPPHLKSSYPAELQFASPSTFKEDDIKTGNIVERFETDMCKLLPGDSNKPRKKDFGTTSYKRPGPPTPSKNAGRLSLQGNEVHPTRDHAEVKITPRRLTPSSRIRALFTGKNNGNKDNAASEDHLSTPTAKRLNIFRRPR